MLGWKLVRDRWVSCYRLAEAMDRTARHSVRTCKRPITWPYFFDGESAGEHPRVSGSQLAMPSSSLCVFALKMHAIWLGRIRELQGDDSCMQKRSTGLDVLRSFLFSV